MTIRQAAQKTRNAYIKISNIEFSAAPIASRILVTMHVVGLVSAEGSLSMGPFRFYSEGFGLSCPRTLASLLMNYGLFF